jgi:hypothetical protein
MRNRFGSLVIFLMGLLVFSSPAFAQIFYTGEPPSDAQKKAAAESKAKLTYDPHDLSGIWRGGGQGMPQPKDDPRIGDAHPDPIMGGAFPPPMTAWGQAQFAANKPSAAESWQSRRVAPALGNDPLGNCDPLGYPRNLGLFEVVQTPEKVLQIFGDGMRFREIYTDGRKLDVDDLDPKWYGWAVGHWDGNTLVVDSGGYDERAWLGGNGWPHSEGMKIHEVYSHPDAMTLEITMTITDPKAYTKPWVGNKRKFNLQLPKGQMVLDEHYCVPSEEQAFNQGVRNPAGGDLDHSRPLK